MPTRKGNRQLPPGSCPDAPSCAGGSPGRQMSLPDAVIQKLDEQTQASISEARGAKRCTYCGLVYLSSGTRLGWWNSGVRGDGWVVRRSAF